MKYSDKEISGIGQASEPETVYAAATETAVDKSLIMSERDRLLSNENKVISNEEIERDYLTLEQLDSHLTKLIDDFYCSRK